MIPLTKCRTKKTARAYLKWKKEGKPWIEGKLIKRWKYFELRENPFPHDAVPAKNHVIWAKEGVTEIYPSDHDEWIKQVQPYLDKKGYIRLETPLSKQSVPERWHQQLYLFELYKKGEL